MYKLLIPIFMCVGLSSPVLLAGQAWTGEVRRVEIDHDPAPRRAEPGEQIPPGYGVALSYIASNSVILGVEHSWGSARRFGAICGGFIFDPETQCIGEIVEYSGGVTAVSVGC